MRVISAIAYFIVLSLGLQSVVVCSFDLNSISPVKTNTAGGTPITLTGSGFKEPIHVRFGSLDGNSPKLISEKEISVLAPKSTPGIVDIELDVAGTVRVLKQAFEFLALPEISKVTPAAGSTSGGTALLIEGNHFVEPLTIRIGAFEAVGIKVSNRNSITCFAPKGPPGSADVSIETPGGDALLKAGYLYVQPAVFTAISPHQASTSGGTELKIVGESFTDVSTVLIDGHKLTFKVLDDKTISALSPMVSQMGLFDLELVKEGLSTTVKQAIALADAPQLTEALPVFASPKGGEKITLFGANFTKSTRVFFESHEALQVVLESPKHLTVVCPALPKQGPLSITASNFGVSSEKQPFVSTFEPTVKAISPDAGPVEGGAPVKIFGSNFAEQLAIFIGGVAVTKFKREDAFTLQAVTPPGKAGPATVTVTNFGAASGSLADGYTYLSSGKPSIKTLSPVSGMAQGGNSVVISGANFVKPVSVFFGGELARITLSSETSITAIAPPGKGTVDVVVISGDQKTGLFEAYTYLVSVSSTLSLKEISPLTGNVKGGEQVKLRGSGFVSPIEVFFGSQASPEAIVIDDQTIVALTPPGTLGDVDVVVRTETEKAGLSRAFRYFTRFTQEELKKPQTINAFIVADPTEGFGSITVNFDGSRSGLADAITAYLWDFGDGTVETTTAPTTTHFYAKPGNFTASLIVQDALGTTSLPYIVPILVGDGITNEDDIFIHSFTFKLATNKEDADTLTLTGVLNPIGLPLDPSLLEVSLILNGIEVQSDLQRFTLKPDGNFRLTVVGLTLKAILGIQDQPGEYKIRTDIRLQIAIAGQRSQKVVSNSVESQVTVNATQASGSGSMIPRPNLLGSGGALNAPRFSAQGNTSGYRLAAQGNIKSQLSTVLAPTGPVSMTLGDWEMIIEADKFKVTGSGLKTKIAFVKNAALPELQRFQIDTAKATYRLNTNFVQGSGIPAAGMDDLIYILPIQIEFPTAEGQFIFATRLEMHRKTKISTKWTNRK